jgi:hypothetical protein
MRFPSPIAGLAVFFIDWRANSWICSTPAVTEFFGCVGHFKGVLSRGKLSINAGLAKIVPMLQNGQLTTKALSDSGHAQIGRLSY